MPVPCLTFSYLHTKLQVPAANLRPPRKFSFITEENIQVGPKRRALCKKTAKCKVRTARRLLVPKSGRKAYVRVQFIGCVCVQERQSHVHGHVCTFVTRRLCAHINKRMPSILSWRLGIIAAHLLLISWQFAWLHCQNYDKENQATGN